MPANIKLEFITPNAEEFIGRMAGICYNSSGTTEACIKRAAKCAQDGHLATLRFAHATFHVSGISRVCSHQFVRSKHLDFLQRSQRYCNEKETTTTIPDSIPDEIRGEWSSLLQSSLSLYKKAMGKGIRKEDARFILTEGTHTEVVVCGNLQAWMDFIKLRADKHAQWEIRDVATQINNILAKECPNIFKEIL